MGKALEEWEKIKSSRLKRFLVPLEIWMSGNCLAAELRAAQTRERELMGLLAGKCSFDIKGRVVYSPKTLTRERSLVAALEMAKKMLKDKEWFQHQIPSRPYCLFCANRENEGHGPVCKMDKFLTIADQALANGGGE